MPRLRGTYLGVLVLGWLLSFGTQVAWGYYPYLKVNVTYDTHSVSYSVYNPQKQQGYEEGFATLGTVVNLQQHNNVVTWAVQEDDGYHVGMTTFDPGPNTFQNDSKGPFTSVSQLQVMDGVVAYVATAAVPGAVPGFFYATYDPIKGTWQQRTWPQMDGFTNLQVTTKDGVVLRRQEIVFISGVALEADIYDAALGKWSSHIVYADQAPYVLQSYSIANASVIITRFTGVEWVTETHGYDHSLGDWYSGATKPMAYFVAQPDFGKKPLWVWFTDMSIGGTSWNWNFGDNVTSTFRSTYHTFTSAGTFHVSQQINGNSTYNHDVIVVNTFDFKKNSLPAIRHLLLNNN